MYKMVVTKTPYNPVLPQHVQEKINRQKLKSSTNFLQKMGFQIIDNQGVLIS
jgi:hypothetical protein